MVGRKGQGRKVERPYGLWFEVKGERRPIRTEKWYENRSDRERDFAALRARFGTNLLKSKRLGKM